MSAQREQIDDALSYLRDRDIVVSDKTREALDIALDHITARKQAPIRWDEKSGQMKPALPKPIADALTYLRAMTEPYFDVETANRAERALRVAIKEALKREALP